MESLDHDFVDLMLLQQQAGGHQYPNGLTHKTFQKLVLEECSPWKEDDIGNGMMQKRMGWMASPMWDINVLGPTIVYQHHQPCSDDKKAVELAIHAAYNTGYSCFYHIGYNI